MENEIMTAPKASAPAPRNIETVTAEINDLRAQVYAITSMYAIEIGRRLVEAKSMLPHGEWGEWLEKEVDFSQSKANDLMRFFKEYGAEQITIFGATAKSQTIANLPYTKALQLLSLPADEREKFVETEPVEDMSVRDLKEAIRERNEARKEAEEAKAREEELAEKASQAEAATAEAEQARQVAEELRAKISALEEKERKTADELKKAKSDPKIPTATMNKIKSDAEKAAAESAAKKNAAEIEKLKKMADFAVEKMRAADARRIEAENALEEARRQLRTANPAVAAFKSLFESVQRTARELKAKISEIEDGDPETAAKLKNALSAFGRTL